ncbi:MAG TPA: hemolysin [Oceanospirillales bacterium]|nr:hemolysin [Oleispira sp.]HCM06748.1 hemolysin [Oceanospirillales bacterium]|tara:strand:- start:1441 stop:2205 length:765 start_codon:yes stop_codon:yes gene_type:complete
MTMTGLSQERVQQAAVQNIGSLTKPLESKLVASFSNDPDEIYRAQVFRANVFNLTETNQDKDPFDDICLHLIVKDSLSNSIVGYSRIITSDLISSPAEFYTASEFDIAPIIQPHSRYMEIGRTSVDPNFRSGAVIGLLWSKIGQYMNEHKIDYLMGCASISMQDGGAKAISVVNHLRENHFTNNELRATPRIPLPQFDIDIDGKQHIPALLKTYIRMGAKVCGEAFLDRDFNVADVVILLAKKDIKARYLRHFA